MVIMVYIPANYENIYLTNGATDAWYQSIMIFECIITMRLYFEVLMEDKRAGVMIPIPQYPLYSAAITELNAHAVRKRERREEGK